jgi:glycosyltransferase involved in cell wall biosynthesis
MSLKLNVIIPCYNEKNTIEIIIDKVLKVNIEPHKKKIIIIDDHSNDGSRDILKKYENKNDMEILYHEKNYGKGKAIRSGLAKVEEGLVLIQDADLEYNPRDYKKLLKPFEEAKADVVYGSRFLGGQEYSRIHYFWHFIANKILTFLCNFFTNLNMTDMETGYKVFKKENIDKIELLEDSFGIEPELTIKLAKQKLRFFEVPISYNGRSYSEGKKIGLSDAFKAIYCIVKYKLF